MYFLYAMFTDVHIWHTGSKSLQKVVPKQRFIEQPKFWQTDVFNVISHVLCVRCSGYLQSYYMLCSTSIVFIFVLISFRSRICSSNCKKNHFVLSWFIRKSLLPTFAYTKPKAHIHPHTLFCSNKNVESGRLENSQHISHKTILNFCRPRI